MCWSLFKLGCLCWSVHIGFSSWGVHIGFSSWGVQVGVFKFVRSSWGVQVVRFVDSWFPSFDGVSLPNTSR
jgi:hypothetical protein